MSQVRIIGGGLAGSEAAWQVARRGVRVVLHEMRPQRPTAVHKTDRLAELVCSNSFRGDKLDNAVGLLKEEMRRLDSLVLRAAAAARVPAGAALAVDRHAFADAVTRAIAEHPLITVVRDEVGELPAPDGVPTIVATGPLTSEALSAAIAAFVGRDHLSFYDAISPIVSAETIDRSKVFRASRWDRSLGPMAAAPADRLRQFRRAGLRRRRRAGRLSELPNDARGIRGVPRRPRPCGIRDRARFRQSDLFRRMPADRSDGPPWARHPAVRADEARGAHRSTDRPAGLRRRATASGHACGRSLQPGRIPDAVEVGRAGTRAADDPRARVGGVRALRHGAPEHVHQRTDDPAADVADADACGSVLRGAGERRRGIRRVGRVGADRRAQRRSDRSPRASFDAAAHHRDRRARVYVSHADAAHYQPTNITFGIMPPLDEIAGTRSKKGADRKLAVAARALADLQAWLGETREPARAAPEDAMAAPRS